MVVLENKLPQKSIRCLLPLFLVLVAAISLLAVIFEELEMLPVGSFRLGTPGTIDFVQYWSAFQLFENGQNPYNGHIMHQIQETVGQAKDQTTLMWNPPWVITMMSPVLSHSFGESARIWLVLNLIFLSVIVIVSAELAYSKRPFILALAGICFVPALVAIQLGQLSLFITCAAISGAYCVNRKYDLLAGILLALCSVKPHLFFLFIIPSILWILTTRRIKIVLGIAFCLALLFFLTTLRWPDSIRWWLESFTEPTSGPGAVPMWLWRTGTLTTLIRMVIGEFTETYPRSPMWAVPLIGLIGTAFFYGSKQTVNWQRQSVPLLCLSLALGAYGWLFDYTILLPGQLILIAWYLEPARGNRERRLLFYSLALVQLFALALCFVDKPDYIYFFWMPLAFLAIWGKFFPEPEKSIHEATTMLTKTIS